MIMSSLLFLGLFFSFTSYSSATYCICKDGVGESLMQKTIDYACGAGADCRYIHEKGACFEPNTVKAHCDYAANSYFQNKGRATGTCDFSGTAIPSNTLPTTVVSGCSYPTSPGQSGTPSGISTTTPGGATTVGTTTGIYGPTGLAPTGGITNIGPNGSSSLRHHPGSFLSLTLTLLLPGLLLLWA